MDTLAVSFHPTMVRFKGLQGPPRQAEVRLFPSHYGAI